MKKRILLTIFILVFVFLNLSFSYSHDHAHEDINGFAFDQFFEDLPGKFENYIFDESSNIKLVGLYVLKPGKLYEDIFEGKQAITFKDWVKHGGYSADEPELFMSLRHFYDPLKTTVDPTLNGGEKVHYLTDHVNSLVNSIVQNYYQVTVDPKMDAKTWAISGPAFRNYKENQYSFSKGLDYLKRAFAETNLTKKEDLFAAAWRSLGETMHLISDMTVPAHVRNDAHPGSTDTRFFYSNLLRGDPYERTVVDNHPELGNVIESVSTITCNESMADAIKDVKNMDNLFDKVSKFANKNFCSIDTVSGFFPYKKITSDLVLTEMMDLGIVCVTNNNYRHPYPEPDMAKLEFSNTASTTLQSASLKENIEFIGFYNDFPAVDLRWFGNEWLALYVLSPKNSYPFKDISYLQAEVLIPIAIKSSKKVMEFFIPEIEVSLNKYDVKTKKLTGKINIKEDQYHKGDWLFNLNVHKPNLGLESISSDVISNEPGQLSDAAIDILDDIEGVSHNTLNSWFRLYEVKDTQISEINPDKYKFVIDKNNIDIQFDDKFFSASKEIQLRLDINFGGFWVQSNLIPYNDKKKDNKEAMVTDIFKLDFTFDQSQHTPNNYIYPNNRGYLKQTNDALTVQVLYKKEIEPYTESFSIYDKDGKTLLDSFDIDIFPAKFNVSCGDDWKGSVYDGGVSLKRKTIEHNFKDGDEKIESNITGEINIKFADDSRIRNATDVETYVNDYVRPYDKIIPIQISDFKGFAFIPKEPFDRGRWNASSGRTAAGYNNYIKGFVIKGHQAISLKVEVYGSSTYNNKDKNWFIGQGNLTMKEIKSILSSITLTPEGTITFNDTKEEYLFNLTTASDTAVEESQDKTSDSTVNNGKIRNHSISYENINSYAQNNPFTLSMTQDTMNDFFKTYPQKNGVSNNFQYNFDSISVCLPDGSYNKESGIISTTHIVRFDKSLDKNPQIIELEFIPELSHNFVIALANLDYLPAGDSLRNYNSTWVQYSSQKNSVTTNLCLFNSPGLDEIVERNWDGLKTPETITLKIYSNKIVVEDSLGNHMEKAIPWVRNGVTARLFVFASNESKSEKSGFALKSISISKEDNQITVRELKSLSIKVLPLFSDNFDTFNRQNWVKYQDCPMNLDKHYAVKEGGLDIAIPAGNDWAIAGIRSRDELFRIPISGETKTIRIKMKEDDFHSYAIALCNQGTSNSLSEIDSMKYTFTTNPLQRGNYIALTNPGHYETCVEKYLDQNHSIVDGKLIIEISSEKATVYTAWGDVLEGKFDWMCPGTPVYLYITAQAYDKSLPAHLSVDEITIY